MHRKKEGERDREEEGGERKREKSATIIGREIGGRGA